MSNELLIIKYQDKILSLLAREKKILQIHVSETEETGNRLTASKEIKPQVGDIYVGKVQNIVKNINAAFVEFAKGQVGYLSLADSVLPRHARRVREGDMRILAGDEIIVQVKREAVKTKPPALTGLVDLTGRYAVLRIGKSSIGISKKIKEKEKREHLKEIFQEYQEKGYGLVARTNSAGTEEEVLREELEALSQRYHMLLQKAEHSGPFTKIESAPAAYLSDIRDGYARDVEQIITDDAQIYEQIRQYIQVHFPQEQEKLLLWDEADGKLAAIYNVEKTISRACQQKVWLKSGAYLVIQPTEALVSIDVNTGKAVSKKKDTEETFYQINSEAAKEIALQLRLRNLSGIILIDFIDMKEEAHIASLMELLRVEVKKDPVPVSVVDMTKLGLVEVTRKKIRRPLHEILQGGQCIR